MSDSFNKQYKQYQKEGGTKSFKEFAEMHNAMKGADNNYSSETPEAFFREETSINSIFEQPKTEKEIQESTTPISKRKKVFGINNNILLVAGAIILISVAVVVYKRNKN